MERRLTEVLYRQLKWYKWVRECQDHEEIQHEVEKKKTQKEAAMFKRHIGEIQARVKIQREREDKRRQDEYLEKITNSTCLLTMN